MINHTIKNDGKIAVHCHAGKGRTGILITSVKLKFLNFKLYFN